ncbi:MAG: hypothetical protein HZC11_02120 [Nitrospirae bacterium]|nr:hypothetical protein [Nitrospirota bacterium]
MEKIIGNLQQQITQHIRFGLLPSPFGTLLPLVATSYMMGTFGAIFAHLFNTHYKQTKGLLVDEQIKFIRVRFGGQVLFLAF